MLNAEFKVLSMCHAEFISASNNKIPNLVRDDIAIYII